MPQINRVAHVVINVSDVDDSVDFYSKNQGMEVMVNDSERGMAFLSFGTQHHDIALFRARGEASHGTIGMNHFAMVAEGGIDELKAIHSKLLENEVDVVWTADHGMTRSVYFNDPDGNRLEIFVENFADPVEGMQFMRDSGGIAKPLDLSEVPV
jgi:catechol 2,3-dioxygenase